MVWGRLDKHIVAVIPAKELRAEIRKRRLVRAPDGCKISLLEQLIEQRVAKAHQSQTDE